MARVKQEWKAQMRSKLQASIAQKALEDVKVVVEAPPARAPVAAEMVASSIDHTEMPPSSANCIDLTFDDDSDEDDEPLGPAAANTALAPAAAQQSPSAEQKVAVQSLPEEAVESDVDEEWPQPQEKTPNERGTETMEHHEDKKIDIQAPASHASVAVHASGDEEHESEEDEELPKRAAVGSATQETDANSPTPAEASVTSAAPSVEASAAPASANIKCAPEVPEASVATDVGMAEASDTTSTEAQVDSANGGSAADVEMADASDATSSELQQEPTSSAPLALATPRSKAVDDEENLEDGEIFEEGAVITSPTQVKQAIAAERLARAGGDSEAFGGSPQQPVRQKKQKKRGKKKSKRKLDAMLMMAGGVPEFDRNTRHHPFSLPPDALPSPLGEHPHTMAGVDNLMMRYGGPPPGFGDHPHAPTALPRLSMHPPPLQHRGPPFGPFADDQILRVNRHGNVAMFNSNSVEYGMPMQPPQPPLPQASQPMFAGGFKYRNIDDRLRTADTTSSTASSSSSNQSPESFRGSAASTKEQGDVGVRSRKQSDVDLDSLRAAALRTKRLLKQPESQQEADAAKKGADEVASTSPDPEACEGAKSSQEAASVGEAPADIEALRAEILRSMMKKKKAVTSAPAAAVVVVAIESSAPSNNAEPDVSPEIHCDSVVPSEANEQSAQEMAPETASAGSTESVAVEQEKVVEREKIAEKDNAAVSVSSPSSSRPATPAVPIITAHVDVISTPKFRPLTASSQSIVIRLSPEDYMKSSKASDASGSGSGEGANAANDSALTIQSAIEEMRKQIAEKEKLRQANRPEAAVMVSSIGPQEASAVPLVSTSGAVANGADGEAPASDSTQPPASSVQQQQKAPTPTMKNAATRSSLQTKIDEMKKRIAAKEREKKNHGANSNSVNSNSASTSAPSSSASSSSSSPRDRLKNGEATHQDGNVARARSAPSAAFATSNSASRVEEPVPAIAKHEPMLEEYRKTYKKCAADYEAATRQVATLDDAIAKLRDQIAAMEPPASTVSS